VKSLRSKKIAIGNDHSGVNLKHKICQFLNENGYVVTNFGTDSEASFDYPDVAHLVANSVISSNFDLGILICGSGQGVAITANRHKNVRAVIAWKPEIAELSRKHNNSNVLCLPARFLSGKEALKIVEIFLNTEFEQGRHLNRIEKIEVGILCESNNMDD
jgi:ribose 5-phosphate isomerase B